MIKKLFKYLPENSLKDKIYTFYYNHFIKNDIYIYDNKDFWEIKFKDTNFKCFKFINLYNIISNLNTLNLYLEKYKLKRGDIVVDCGAYIGIFSLYASKIVGKEGKVITFEPEEGNHKKLLNNIKLNNLDNIIPIKKGIWNKSSILKFNSGADGSSSLFFEYNRQGKTSIPVVSLDNELKKRGIKRIDFIKMDIEGAEIKAIEGAKNILKDNNVSLAIASYHIINGEKTYLNLEKMLSTIGYKTETLFPEHLTTYATKKL